MSRGEGGSLSFSARWRSNIFRAPWFFLATALFGSASLLASLFDREGKLQHRIAHQWARVSLQIAGAPIEVIGKEHLRPLAVYAANHASYMDTPAIFASLPFQFRILAKESLWRWPFIGWHLNRSGQIPVSVETSNGSVAGLNRALRALRSGMPLFIFPEGSRTPNGRLQSFMNGPAFLAIRAQVPLIPIALVGTHELLPMHTSHFRPGPVRVVVGEPIDTTGFKIRQADDLTARLRGEILRLSREYSESQASARTCSKQQEPSNERTLRPEAHSAPRIPE
jgi:1-acyl-sn-glycerol-3-phosphate acyltransferase